MTLRINNSDDVYKWSTEQLWNVLNLLEPDELEAYDKEITLIKKGIFIKVPIIYIIKKWSEENPHNKRITIKGYGKFGIIDYYDEIDERNKLMRRIIIENIENEDPTSPRT